MTTPDFHDCVPTEFVVEYSATVNDLATAPVPRSHVAVPPFPPLVPSQHVHINVSIPIDLMQTPDTLVYLRVAARHVEGGMGPLSTTYVVSTLAASPGNLTQVVEPPNNANTSYVRIRYSLPSPGTSPRTGAPMISHSLDRVPCPLPPVFFISFGDFASAASNCAFIKKWC